MKVLHILGQLRIHARASCACLASVTAIVLAGCGSSSSSTTSSAATGSGTAHTGGDSIRIAGVPGDLTDQFFTAMKCGAQDAARQAGASLSWQAPSDYTVSSASTLLRSIASTKPSGIMLEGSFTGTGLSTQVKTLMQSGIPVTIVDVPIAPAVYYKAFYSDNGGSGKLVASSVNSLLSGSGSVGIITATPGALGEGIRTTSFEKGLKAYPNIHVVSVQYADRDTAKAAQEASAMITGNPNLKLIYATDGPQAEGAESAIAAAHKQGSVKLIAFDATPQEVHGVRSGAITGLVAQTPYLMAYNSVQAMIKLVKSGIHGAVNPLPSSQQNVVTPFTFITKQNVDSPKVKREFEYPASC